jgi:hypothetical protein
VPAGGHLGFLAGVLAGLVAALAALLYAAARYVASDMERFRAWLEGTGGL